MKNLSKTIGGNRSLKKILIRMKLTFLFLLTGLIAVSASTYSQNTRLDLKVKDNSIIELFKEIENRSEFYFFYQKEELAELENVSIDVTKAKVTEILDEALSGTNLEYKIIDRYIIVRKDGEGLDEIKSNSDDQKSITGSVNDEAGQPLPGVTIVIKGSTNGTVTNMDGNYSISNVPENATLVFSFVGMKTIEVPVEGKSVVDVIMEDETIGIDEVVAIGYGTARKKDLTGALTRINADDKATQPNINAVQTMRGSVAGLRVTDNGKAGSDGSIVIRGYTSITANNEPLIVLDGIPMVGSKLSDISSNDIESIDILKDASSAAIYGSRATNGVILITTKRGKDSKPVLNYSGYYGFSDFARTPNIMGPDAYLQLKTDATAFLGGQAAQFNPIEQEVMDAGEAISPWDAISQDAPMMNHDLSVSGKTDRINYYVSGSWADQKSVIMGDQFKRLTLRGNLDIKVNNWLNLGTNTGYSYKDYSGVEANIGQASQMSPFSRYIYPDGQPVAVPMGDVLPGNPIFNTLWQDNYQITNNLFSNIYADIKLPVNGLTFRLNVANNLRYNETKNFTPTYDRDGSKRTNFASQNWGKQIDFTLENILKYNKTFNIIHHIDATFMYGIESTKNTGMYGSGSLLFSDALGYYGVGLGDVQTASASGTEMKAVSSMVRIGYRLYERYMLNLTVRRDGYSAFGSGNKYGNFPSVGLGWVISEENFLTDIKWLEFLKLRYSYGRNGNRAISPYSSLSLMDATNYKFVFGDGGATSVGVSPTSMSNPNLGWESTLASNFGVDFNVFSGRISGAFEFYNMNTEDLLLSSQIPNMTGYSTFTTNVGSVNNKGVEITLNTVNVKSDGFEWVSTITYAKNNNEITDLMDIDGDGIGDDDPSNRRFIGKPMFSYFDYVWDGIWQEGEDMSMDPGAKAGFVKFKDVSGPDGVPDGKIDPLDREVLFSSLPVYTASLTNTLSYKGISFSFMFYTSQGGKASNTWINPGTNFYQRLNQLDLPYWTPENPLNDRPSVGYPNPKGYGFYEDRSFIRLQDISLSYDLPKTLLDKAKFGGMKVYVSGKNLATWTNWNGWDPEHAAGYDPYGPASQSGPLMKSLVVGLILNF
jgi:TonB-dependent starch-binding outer membrane protein SusC